MQKKLIKLKNSACLHARPAVKIVEASNKFASEILLSANSGSNKANAKSMTSILSLGATEVEELYVEASGIDEKEAIEAISNIIITL